VSLWLEWPVTGARPDLSRRQSGDSCWQLLLCGGIAWRRALQFGYDGLWFALISDLSLLFQYSKAMKSVSDV